jgi:hypothetical protein
MSVQCEVTAKQAAGAPMSVFERWLTLWVALCILAAIPGEPRFNPTSTVDLRIANLQARKQSRPQQPPQTGTL